MNSVHILQSIAKMSGAIFSVMTKRNREREGKMKELKASFMK